MGQRSIGDKRPVRADDLFQSLGRFPPFASHDRRERGADVIGDVNAAIERAVGEIANERFLFKFAQARDPQDRRRIGGDDRADVPKRRESQRRVILGADVLDP